MRKIGLSLFLCFVCAAVLAQNKPAPQTTTQQSGSETPLTPDQIRDLIRKAADNDMENDKKQRDYTYVERDEEHKLDNRGGIKSTESKTYDVMEIYDEQVQKLTAKNDQPLSAKEAQKEDDKIQKIIDKRKNESEDDRKKRLEKDEKEREDNRKFVKEVADAYNFTYVGMDTIEGRESYIIDGNPKPGYEPKMKEAKILPKFRFRAWIDKDEAEWKKLDIECIDTVSFGWFIARLHQGSRIDIEQTRVNDEVWLPQRINIKIDARVALLKEFNMGLDIAYRDYKKFRTATRIIPLGEAAESH